MLKRFVRSVAVIAVLAVGASLLSGPASGTAGTTHHTLSAARTYVVGKWTSGPNAYTKWQRIQITGTHTDPCFPKYVDIDDVMHQYANPASPTTNTPLQAPYKLAPSPNTATVCPTAARTGAAAAGGIVLVSWWNPFSWDWGHIMSTFWNTLWDHCLSGAAAGVVGTASGTVIINLLARGGVLFVGPYGYAAIAIGGCVVQLLW